MKKIIEGRMYNTDTAVLIGSGSSDLPRTDLYYWEEALYRTKSGAYFIHGAGGPGSQYAEKAGSNTWRSGESIEPISPSRARAWAEKRMDPDDYAEAFEEPEEAGEGRDTLNLTVSAMNKARLMLMREESGQSMSRIVEGWIEREAGEGDDE